MSRLTLTDGYLIRVTRGDPPATVAAAKQNMVVDHATDDKFIESIILSVQDELEPPNGWLGRALMTSTFKFVLPKFATQIVIPAPPLDKVEHIKYIDTDGVLQTASADLYRIIDKGDEPSIVQLEDGEQWPDTSKAEDAVQITFDAGYEDLPEIIAQYVLMMVAYRYDYRTVAMAGQEVKDLPGVRHMLESWRVR